MSDDKFKIVFGNVALDVESIEERNVKIKALAEKFNDAPLDAGETVTIAFGYALIRSVNELAIQVAKLRLK